MPCLDDNALSEFVEGLLDEDAAAAAEAHLDECDACREAVAEVARLLGERRTEARGTASSRTDVDPVRELFRGDAVDRYVVLERVGVGGMGVVYSAYDPELDRKIALKVLRSDSLSAADPEEARSRFHREAQALARLSHPNVVSVHDVKASAKQLFIAMEYIDGPTLRGWLGKSRRETDEIVDVFVDAARGLSAAHGAGVVHRDFKPENVLVARDGRGVVTDFGLARAPHSLDPPATSPAAIDLGDLTQTGALLGTPAYMAPEQIDGEPATEKSDQFAFCVALWEALYGERPFGGDTLAQIRAQIRARNTRGRDRSVPAKLRKAVLRGLSPDPDARHASMETLIHSLTAGRPTALRRAAVASVAVVIAAAGALGYRSLTRETPMCGDGGDYFAGVWDDAKRQTIHAAFEASQLPFARDAWTAISAELDAYRTRWEKSYTDACVATNIRGDQSAELLDRRMLCLRRGLEQMRAMSEVLAEPTGALIENSVSAAFELPAVALCDDVESLSTQVSVPAEPVHRSALDGILGDLSAAWAMVYIGRYADAKAMASDAVERARQTGHRPTEAEALYFLGSIKDDLGDDTAIDDLYEAYYAASAGNHSEFMARSAILIAHQSALAGDEKNARRWERAATSAAERLSDHVSLMADLENNLGVIDSLARRYADALVHYQRSMEITEADLGETHPLTAQTLGNIASMLYRLGRLEESIAAQRKTISMMKSALGETHPTVATAMSQLANALSAAQLHDEALEQSQRSLELRIAALGSSHPDVVAGIHHLANIYATAGRYADAEPLYQRALAILATQPGEQARGSTMSVLNDLADVMSQQNNYSEARDLLEKVLTLKKELFGDDHPKLGPTLSGLGDAYLGLGDHALALDSSSAALAIDEKALGPTHPLLAYSLTGVGRAELGLRRPTRALPHLERALALRTENATEPVELARTQFALAKALSMLGRDPKRARELATSAQQSFAAAGEPFADEVVDVNGWLTGLSP